MKIFHPSQLQIGLKVNDHKSNFSSYKDQLCSINQMSCKVTFWTSKFRYITWVVIKILTLKRNLIISKFTWWIVLEIGKHLHFHIRYNSMCYFNATKLLNLEISSSLSLKMYFFEIFTQKKTKELERLI